MKYMLIFYVFFFICKTFLAHWHRCKSCLG